MMMDELAARQVPLDNCLGCGTNSAAVMVGMMSIDFLKVDVAVNGHENILVFTDVFT